MTKFDLRGLFGKIFRPDRNRRGREALRQGNLLFDTLSDYAPAFRSWQGEIYESGLVRSAIDARARHISKLNVELRGSAQPSLQAKLRQGPNPWQTWSQFLYRVSTILDLHNTAFVVPVLDENLKTTGYFPVLPMECEIVEFQDAPWLRYRFARGDRAAVELDRCAVLVKHQYRNDFFGEDNAALHDTMKLIAVQNQAIEIAAKNSAVYRFMARLTNFTSAEDLAKERGRFTALNLSAEAENSGGVLLFPNTYSEIQQVKQTPYTVNAAQMKQIQENVANYFGVSEKLMRNAAPQEELDAFFGGCVEPFAIQFSEAMTRAVFTERERSGGAALVASPNRFSYMTTAAKTELVRQLGDRGALSIDEIRELFSYPPLPEGEGAKNPIRGEYHYANGRETEGA